MLAYDPEFLYMFPQAKGIAMEDNKPFLPHDILIEILKRLPVKSLIRFQSVCRSWKILIKSPSFIASHLHQSAHKNPFLLLRGYFNSFHRRSFYLVDCKMEMTEVPIAPLIDPLGYGWKIVGSCNGLLCVVTSNNCDVSESLFLWNPAIREVMQVPGNENDSFGSCSFGFGFSAVINDYKIVKLHYYLNSIFVKRVEVYSLITRSWKELKKGILQKTRVCTLSVVGNGTIFWLGLGGKDGVVVSFDIAAEEFTLIPNPASSSKGPMNMTLYKNKLALFHLNYHVIENHEYSIDLWVLEDHTGASGKSWSWTKICNNIGLTSTPLFPLCIWRNQIVCELQRSNKSGTEQGPHLFSFNLTTNKWNNFPCTLLPKVFRFCDVSDYVESLVSFCNIHPC